MCLLNAGLPTAQAAQFVTHGEYKIHYTTFSSMIIPNEVAAAHGIVRASNRIVLNISVQQADKPSVANVTGRVTNLLNQQFELEFDEVTESEAVYYLASHLSLDHDILRFSLEVQLGDNPSDNPGDNPGDKLVPTIVPIDFLRRYD